MHGVYLSHISKEWFFRRNFKYLSIFTYPSAFRMLLIDDKESTKLEYKICEHGVLSHA